jgi:hypothetical protein
MNLPFDVKNFLETVSVDYGDMKILPKSSSKLMKAIGWLFGVTKISPEFMTQYITIIGNTVYYPDQKLENPDSESMVRVIAHETMHVADSKRFSKPLFSFLYLFPQSLAVLSLLSFLAFWKLSFLWCLLFLLCLAPIPAPFRYLFELRAYRVNLLFARKADNLTDEQMISYYEWVEKQLCTSLYYWTWPFPSVVRKHLMDQSTFEVEIYKKISNWIIIRRATKKIMDIHSETLKKLND